MDDEAVTLRNAVKAAASRARHEWVCTHGVKGKGIDDAITDAVMEVLEELTQCAKTR